MRKKVLLGGGFLRPCTCRLCDEYFLLEQIIHFHACLTQFRIRSRNRNCEGVGIAFAYRISMHSTRTWYNETVSFQYAVRLLCLQQLRQSPTQIFQRSEEAVNCNSTSIIKLSRLDKVRNEFGRIRHTCCEALIIKSSLITQERIHHITIIQNISDLFLYIKIFSNENVNISIIIYK